MKSAYRATASKTIVGLVALITSACVPIGDRPMADQRPIVTIPVSIVMQPPSTTLTCECATKAASGAKPVEPRDLDQVSEKLVPLCPAIAEVSYPNAKKPGELVNYFLTQEARRKKVTIDTLSSFSAQLRGRKSAVMNIVANYRRFLCAFNPSLQNNAASTYTSCMAHAEKWIDIVQKNPGELMLSDNMFKENCVNPAK